jgi:hypothetical protein
MKFFLKDTRCMVVRSQDMARGLTKCKEETFGGDRYLIVMVATLSINVCQSLSDCAFEIGTFYIM